jgi:excisionase family DNA binding protein
MTSRRATQHLNTATAHAAAQPQFISRQQAAQLLGVSLSTVDKLIDTKALPAYRVLRTVRLQLADVLAAAVPR